MPDIDLYVIHKLDRRQPPEALAAQLTDELNNTDPRDSLTRSRVETARVILGDPARRARYDRQLDDPGAPEITELTLAQLAGRPAPTAPSGGGLFATTKVKVMTILIGAVVVVLAIAVTAVACSSGGGGDTTAAKGPASASKSASSCYVYGNSGSTVEALTWRESEPKPKGYIVLTAQYDLPAEFAPMATRTDFPKQSESNANEGLSQNQDRTISVAINNGPETERVVHVTQDGQVVSEQTYAFDAMPTPFDLSKPQTTKMYFQIAPAPGVSIPAGAAGTHRFQEYANALMPDAFDETTMWLLLRGSDKLYKGSVFTLSQLRIDDLDRTGTVSGSLNCPRGD